MFCVKIHEKNGIKILAVCDENLLDKELEIDNVKIKISRNFYLHRYVDEKELEKILREERFEVINAFGNEAIDFLIKKGFINEKNILIVCGQKHAVFQIL